jgi:hypothetical protein
MTNDAYDQLKGLVIDQGICRVIEALACIARDQEEDAGPKNFGPAVAKSWHHAAHRLDRLAIDHMMPL